MTLAQRLLVAISVLVVATTAVLALSLRAAWQSAEEDRFEKQFEAAVLRLETEIGDEIRDLPSLVAALCEHDPVLDAALVDLRAGALAPERRLSLSLRVPELAKALRLDELVLFTGDGEILGAARASGRVGAHDPRLRELLRKNARGAGIRKTPAPVAVDAHCSKTNGRVTLGLYAAMTLDSALARIGASQGLSLTLGEPASAGDLLSRAVKPRQLEGVPVFASRSRVPLLVSLRQLDTVVVALGAGTFLAALTVAWFLARGLARPIVDLSTQARRVVAEDPVPVRARGGRELEELASSFNQAISDLAALRKRLAATERIAARREIARRVAHEIKNPLAPIRAAVETLRRLRARNDPAFDEYFDEATRTVLDEVLRIAHIVQEFTRFARMPPPNPAPMDLVATVRDVVRLHESADGSSARVEFSAEDVPEIVADRDQLVQVATNLLQNALDATKGVASPRVSVRISADGPHRVRLTISDNGPGVPPEMRDRLFEPYATTKEHGTGLGLPIVERIVVEHGGEITHRDANAGGPAGSPGAREPGARGAEFSVVLPILGPTLLPEPPPDSSPAG